MAYLGNDLQVAFPVYRNIDDISGSFNSVLTTFPLTVSGVAPIPAPLYSQQCLISVGGVVQRPDDSGTEGFRLSGSNIIFASAPTTGADFFGVILAGADYINAGANFPSGSAAVPSITFDSDLDTGIYNSGANQVSITTSGTERLRIDSAGQIESVSLGTAAAPAFSFTTDANTGIYSPGADQVAISTGGSGRLFVDSSGRVGVGTANPTSALHIDVASGEPFRLRSQTAGSNYFTHVNHAGGDLAYVGAGGGAALNSGTTSDYAIRANQGALLFGTNGNNERLRITSAGLVGVGTSSPGSILHCNYATATDTYIRTTNSAGTNGFDFGVSSGGEAWVFNRNNSNMYLGTNSAQRVTITAGGNVGIGTTSPSELLHVSKDQNAITAIKVTNPNTGASAASYLSLESGTKNVAISAYNAGSSFQIQGFGGIVTQYQDFDTHIWRNNAGTERARIDSSGRLLVGTSTSLQTKYQASSFQPGFQSAATVGTGGFFRYSADSDGPAFVLSKSRNASLGSQTVLVNEDTVGYLGFAGSDGTAFQTAATILAQVDGTPGANDMPGRLVFSTTADGASSPTERMRIAQNGVITIQNGAVAVIGTLTDGATITPDFAADCNFTVTLGGNRTIANPTNITAGQSGSIFIVQDGTGSRTLSWGSFWDFPGGTAPTLSTAANAVDRIDYIVRSSTSIHTVFTANYS